MLTLKTSRFLAQKGFTLIETMFVALLFPMLMLSAFAVIDSAGTIFRTHLHYEDLNRDAMQTLRSVSREIGQTSSLSSPSHLSITADASGNSVVTFQIPVDWDNDGDAYSGTLTPLTEWGAYDYPGHTRACHSSSTTPACTSPQRPEIVGRWARYSVSGTQLVREVLDSSLVPVSGTRQVVCNRLSSQGGAAAFRVVKNQKVIDMSLQVSKQDTIGQKGNQVRTVQLSFPSRTILRNSDSTVAPPPAGSVSSPILQNTIPVSE